ncbi:MAG: hypothetical protein CL913_10930 [Deltaproteobacteria bacterium]|nr:hypothetical protein [Deltaproteobacteria bacterium]
MAKLFVLLQALMLLLMANLASANFKSKEKDTRSDFLQRATIGWNTDWSKHSIEYHDLLSGGPPRDGIPPIDQPKFIENQLAAQWLKPNDPVIALEINGDARAYPLQILTWHEIVNDVVGEIPVTITFCPLCNSAIVFKRNHQGITYDFGTSGLLRHSDLVMYDRQTESLWQQFTGEAIVGVMTGEQLMMIPSGLIGFEQFQAAYPAGKILSKETGYSREYGRNPYPGYDDIRNNPFLFRDPLDERLPAMARVVTVSDGKYHNAYPVELLEKLGVIHHQLGNQAVVIFHQDGVSSALDTTRIANGDDVGATGVFVPLVGKQELTFIKERGFVDEQTGSHWNIVGQAILGPLKGKQLERLVHADQFWFSWGAFRPDTLIYQVDE